MSGASLFFCSQIISARYCKYVYIVNCILYGYQCCGFESKIDKSENKFWI